MDSSLSSVLACSAIGSLAWLNLSYPLAAQIVPDQTLPVPSQVQPGCTHCTVTGGTVRGLNLFHSFQEFSVLTGGSVHFESAPWIQTILGRVTGTQASTIDGLIQTNGTTNLFLLNPNGITFGPHARLQINGSFVSSTASHFKFADGSEFSATNPQAPPLLTVSVTPGVQYGPSSPGVKITSQAQLAAGQDLVLMSDRLDLKGQLSAGRSLQLLGNQITSGNTRLLSGESLLIRNLQGGLSQVTSQADPIVTTAGDVDLSINYEGPALLIEAGGNVQLQGTVTITAADPGAAFVGDDAVLNQQAGLIVRSGQSSRRYASNEGTVDGNTVGVGLVTAPGITLQGAVTVAPEGIVRLTAEGAGSINTQGITVPAGTIALTSDRSITTNAQVLDVSSPTQSAGSLMLTALNGSLSTGDLLATTGDPAGQDALGDGGKIQLTSVNGDLGTGNILVWSKSEMGSLGNGSQIKLSSINGNIQTGNLDAQGYSFFNNAGNGAQIQIATTNGTVQLGDIDASVITNGNSVGDGGTIVISNQTGRITTGNLSTAAISWGTVGVGGTVRLSGQNTEITTGSLEVRSGSVFGQAGSGGMVALVTQSGNITVGGRVDVTSQSLSSAGQGGTIAITTGQGDISTYDLDASSSGSQDNPSGLGGSIRLTAPQGKITTGYLNTSSSSSFGAAAAGGDVFLLGQGTIQTQQIVTASLSSGFGTTQQAGKITLTSMGGDIRTSELLSFSAAFPILFNLPLDIQRFVTFFSSGGPGGEIRLAAAQDIETGLISTISGRSGSGDVSLTAGRNLRFAPGSVVSTDSLISGNSGAIQLSARSIFLNQTQMSASIHGEGMGSRITITAPDLLEIQGTMASPVQEVTLFMPYGATVFSNVYLGGYLPAGDPLTFASATSPGLLPSGIFSQNTLQSSGQAGDIQIQTGQLRLLDGAAIGTTTFSSGQGSNITIQAKDVVLDRGSIFAGTAPNSTGASGKIEIQTESLTLSNGARLQSQTLGQGNAGEINVVARNSIQLMGENTSLLSGTGDSSWAGENLGAGGTIRLTAPELQISDRARIDAATYSNGNGGNIILKSDRLQLQQQSLLNAETRGAGAGGNLEIQTGLIDLADQSVIRLTAAGTGRGGTVDITAHRFIARGGSAILTETSGAGAAGNINLFVQELVSLSGAGTQLSASTASGSTGAGGNIFIDPQLVLLQEGAKIAVSAQGLGNGGNLEMIADRLVLDQAALLADTQSSDGGDITLNLRDLLLMRRGSLISTTAGTAQAGGNGGNVTIKAGFVVAVPQENNDIQSNAFAGNGGRVTIESQGIYGLRFQTQLTPFSDVTASSQLGVSGTVMLTTPSVEVNPGRVTLPVTLLNSTTQVAQVCSRKQRNNSFVITGRGGLSPEPSESINQTPLWQAPESNALNPRGSLQATGKQAAIAIATGWSQQPNGRILLQGASGSDRLPNSIAQCPG